MSEAEDPMDPASETESSLDIFDASESNVNVLRSPTEGADWAEAADWGIIMTDEAIEDSDESDEWAISATLML